MHQVAPLGRCAAGAVLALVLVSACGEPGLPTRGVALETQTGGERELVIEACSPVTRVDLGTGQDMYGKRTISLEFDGSSKSVRIPLDGDAGGTFAAGDSEALAHLDTPFFVRVKGTGGDSSITTTFADQPEPGYAATIVHNGDSNNTVVPLRELHLHPDCSFTGGKS